MVHTVATWQDVRDAALALPGATERVSNDGLTQWRVNDKSDLAALGAEAPDGPILAVRVPDVGVKEALLAEQPDIFFTTPHFDGYPAILARLERLTSQDLTELLVEAWLDRAPKRLAREYTQKST